MIASAENRRGTALSEIERYRATFAEKLRRAVDRAENSNTSAAPFVPQAPAAQEAV
jgi:hypothetical protein